MKKIFVISLVAGLILITGCDVRLSECDKNSDDYNTLYRGRNYHNQIVIFNQQQKVIENQELIIKQNEEILKELKASVR